MMYEPPDEPFDEDAEYEAAIVAESERRHGLHLLWWEVELLWIDLLEAR